MGRPPKADSDKRKLIGARFDPVDKSQIEAFAEASGRSAGSEVERRVMATIDLDEAGLELIEEIGREIAAIQRGMNGKRWHKDLVVWSAVTHMLRTGPIMGRRPDSPNDDEAVQEAYQKLSALKYQRKELVAGVSRLGIAWVEEPPTQQNALARYSPVTSGLFGNAFANIPPVNPRERERRAIEAAPEGDKVREELLSLHKMLCDLDQQIGEANTAWSNLLADYWMAEREGRDWNRNRQRDRAHQLRKEGLPADYYQLTGTDPWQFYIDSPLPLIVESEVDGPAV
jgi:hypothetical protein